MGTVNDTWPEECLLLINSLESCRAEWFPTDFPFLRKAGHRGFTKAVNQKQFMIKAFRHADGNRLKMVACLGPWAEGWAGIAHGGAILALHDEAMLCLCSSDRNPLVTPNCTVSYVRYLPLGTGVVVNVGIEERLDRKILMNSQMHGIKEPKTLYSAGKGLFLEVVDSPLLDMYKKLTADCSVAEPANYLVEEEITGDIHDLSLPTAEWPEVASTWYREMIKCTKDENPVWKRIRRSRGSSSGNRSFLGAANLRQFIFSCFCNITEKRCKCIVVFAPWSEGGPMLAHGGAIGAIHDAGQGVLLMTVYGAVMTVDLSIDYHRACLIGQTYLLESRVISVEGRKLMLHSKITSLDGVTVFSSARGIFVTVAKSNL